MMKRKRKCDHQCGRTEAEIKQLLLKLGKLHGYCINQINEERIFGPPKDISHENVDSHHEIFMYNIPCDCYEDQLLPLLLKAGPIYTLRFIANYNDSCTSYAFVKYVDQKSVQYACNLLNGFEIAIGHKLVVSQIIKSDKLFIGNIKLKRAGFYRIQNKLMELLRGLKRMTFYSASKYGRYSVLVEFFHYCDMELGQRVLICDKMFQYYPEIIIDCYFRCGPRTEPAVIFEWENDEDSTEKHPKVTILDTVQARHLQFF